MPTNPPLYPGDLVVREDKAAVADAVRKFANGATHSADMAIRLKDHPDEPVALTIAGARGLGDAAVLLSLKDNGEETRLKREVAQATKMQAVGQLAGGVAHDFNNILTAIIGHCDLMLMRHSPGDSDYDDIQQVKANSNRAASLTRQLLAFSRQQTLRPQVLQLPDVISEVSQLLKRLMGETVKLEDPSWPQPWCPVRADPGQLEQVVVNLAVNARDAMVAKDPTVGGTLTISTRAVTAADVRKLGNDILPVADYSLLEIADTGVGHPAGDRRQDLRTVLHHQGESARAPAWASRPSMASSSNRAAISSPTRRPGQGATFSIFLPVHTADEQPAARNRRARRSEGQARRSVGHRHDPAGRGRGYGARRRRTRADSAGLYRADRGTWRGRAGAARQQRVGPTCSFPTWSCRRWTGRRWSATRGNAIPDLPILFMSGYAEEQLRKSIDLDNVAFLPKPFSVQQLAEAARDVLAAAANG